jgi:hypothetical protein
MNTNFSIILFIHIIFRDLGTVFNWIGKNTKILIGEKCYTDWCFCEVKPLSSPNVFQTELNDFFQQFQNENEQLGRGENFDIFNN